MAAIGMLRRGLSTTAAATLALSTPRKAHMIGVSVVGITCAALLPLTFHDAAKKAVSK